MNEVWLLLDSRGMGGIESHVGELAAGLLAAGEAPRVLLLNDFGPHPLLQRLARDDVSCVTLRKGPGELIRRLLRDRPRVLHTHGYKANIIGRVAGKLTNTPTVASYHAGEVCTGRLALYDWLDRWTSCLGARIAVSQQIQARMPFGAALVPNFVAVPGTSRGAGPRAVGFVGRLVPVKGPDRFLQIASTRLDIPHLVYGDGPMQPELNVDRPENVVFRGLVPSMTPHWPEIGLLVISSRAEGLPLAALEAMAHGVPVASFALGGLSDLIEDGRNGLLVAADDLDALSGAVGQWLSLTDAQREAMACAAWQTVSSRFGRAAGVTAIRALYPRLKEVRNAQSPEVSAVWR